MATRWAALLLAAVLLAAGCGDDNQGTGSAVGSAGDETAGGGDAADTDDTTTAGGAQGDNSSATPGDGPAFTGEVTCTIVDGGVGLELGFVNDTGGPASYYGDVEVFVGDDKVQTTPIVLVYVLPDEAVREYFFTGVGPDAGADSCDAADVAPTAERPIPPLAFGEVTACANLRESETGGYAHDITIENTSEHVAATFSVRTAIRNSAGERIATAISLGKGVDDGFAAIEPGETWTTVDTVGGPPYTPDATCDVVAITADSADDFFSADGGVEKGTLSSDVGFATGSADLTTDANVLLQSTIERLATYSGAVCIDGYADSVGADADNLELSQARADAVAAYLTDNGVTVEIEAIGHGESLATADEVDDPDLRRVDITLAACGG